MDRKRYAICAATVDLRVILLKMFTNPALDHKGAHALIFVVDSAKPEELPEVQSSLYQPRLAWAKCFSPG